MHRWQHYGGRWEMQLTDPVIACSVLTLSAKDLLEDLATMDRLSPTLYIHDLGRLAQRFVPIATRSGLTCDCVITDQGDAWLWWHRHWVGA
jgi:hypothetical protein